MVCETLNTIHPTAVVHKNAKLGQRIRIGPYCVVGAEVVLEDEVHLHSHVVVEGRTTLRKGCEVYPFASLGHAPQDLKYQGELSTLEVGPKTVIREYVTIQPGTRGGRMKTVVGGACLLMGSVHIAHDCVIGEKVIMANHATLGGHVVVEDGAVIGGLAAVHQFVRIGKSSMIGGLAGIVGDVIPYGMVGPSNRYLVGLNITGLKRRGVQVAVMRQLQKIYTLLFENRDNTLEKRIEEVCEMNDLSVEGREMLDFIKKPSKRGLCLPHWKSEPK